MRPPPSRILLSLLLLCLLQSGGFAAAPAVPVPADAVQLLADVTLMDGTCKQVAVDFGRAFQVADAMGLRASDVMPSGRLRAAFEAATRTRLAQTSPTELCEEVAKAYVDRVPGLLRAR